jgi:hypothetical protein
MWAGHRVGIGLLYRPARLHRLAEFIPWNRFRGTIHVQKYQEQGWLESKNGSYGVTELSDRKKQGVTKRCRLSFLTNSALVIRVQLRG